MIATSTAPPAPSVERALRNNHEWIFSQLGEAIEAAEVGDRVTTRMIFAIFARRLRRHLEVEEELLAKLALGPNRTMAAHIEEVVEEHLQLARILEEISDELEGDENSPPSRAVDGCAYPALVALRAQLEAHERKEGVTLYRMCDELLSPAVRVSAIRELDRRIYGPSER